MRILNYKNYNLSNILMNEFIDHLTESNAISNLDEISSIVNKLGLNIGLIDEIGNYSLSLQPLIEQLVINSKLNIELSSSVISIMALTTTCVFYLDEYKSKKIPMLETYLDADAFRDDIRFLLEELKLAGVGNGIVKKITECLNAISKIIELLFDGSGLFDMQNKLQFNKVCNSIHTMICDHSMNMNVLIENFTIVNDNISSAIAKNGMSDIMTKLNIKMDQSKEDSSIVVDIDSMVDPSIGDVILETDLKKTTTK